MSTTRCIIITARCRLHGTYATAFHTVRNSARARKISKEQMLPTVRLPKNKALVATYWQLTKSLTVQS